MDPIIPLPTEILRGQGYFSFSTPIVCLDVLDWRAEQVARELAALLSRHTARIFSPQPAVAHPPPPNAVYLSLTNAPITLGPEGYVLEIKPGGIHILAREAAGLFHATQTLRQLLPPEGPVERLPCMRVVDKPRFPWRGLMLDVSRHFFPLSFLKRYLDLLASYKLNIFHWHLTDDQGWRIEIRKYPELIRTGAWRESHGQRYGGYYTQDEVRELVAYAAERFITIVPEIEMPGHSVAALAAHPELSCTGGPFTVWTEPGISEDVYCAGNEETFQFLETVLDEVLDLFPGPYLHLGGDETPKKRWAACPKCQARIREEGLAGEAQLETWFLQRMARFVAARGRRVIAWDDVMEGGAPEEAIIMFWQDATRNHLAAARAGHDVVMAPTSHCYFDYKQADDRNEPGQHGVVPLEQSYAFEPLPPELAPSESARVLGGQANVWTEQMERAADVEFMTLPRLCAVAESLWSTPRRKNWTGFRRRLQQHTALLDQGGWRYRPLTPLTDGGPHPAPASRINPEPHTEAATR